MDDDIRKSLLVNKGLPFQKLYEECLVKIQRMKQKNDFMQRQIGNDLEDTIKQEVRRQRDFIERQIIQIKQIIDEIQERYRDPESKNKLKSIKADSQKQIQRNKIIMKDLITKSFLARSRGDVDPNDDQQKYIDGGKIHYGNFNDGEVKQSVITDKSQDNMVFAQELDFQIQRKILAQKKQLLDEVEQTTLRVNAIITDTAAEVYDQGQKLDVIDEQLQKAKKNVDQTNEQISQASKLQKKSRKKYAFLVILIIFVLLGVFGVLYLTGVFK